MIILKDNIGIRYRDFNQFAILYLHVHCRMKVPRCWYMYSVHVYLSNLHICMYKTVHVYVHVHIQFTCKYRSLLSANVSSFLFNVLPNLFHHPVIDTVCLMILSQQCYQYYNLLWGNFWQNNNFRLVLSSILFFFQFSSLKPESAEKLRMLINIHGPIAPKVSRQTNPMNLHVMGSLGMGVWQILIYCIVLVWIQAWASFSFLGWYFRSVKWLALFETET